MRANLAWILLVCGVASARAELESREVAILTMARSGQSRRLADYYAEVRAIPKSQIFLLDGTPQEVLSRAEWEETTRPSIRDWLVSNQLEGKIRCFVTVGDVPLKIGPRDPKSRSCLERQTQLDHVRLAQVQQSILLLRIVRTLIGAPPQTVEPTSEATYLQLAGAFDSLVKQADLWRRKASQQQRAQFDAKFERIYLAAGGIRAMVAVSQAAGDKMSENAIRQLQAIRGRLEGLEQGYQALMSLPDTAARDAQILNLVQQIGGSLGMIRWVDDQLEQLRKNETYASFDSELSMLLWPEYSLSRWQPNGLYYRFDPIPGKHRTLMVSRLSAASSDLVLKMIDAAVAAEKSGLDGTVYLDARGLDADPKTLQPGSTTQYDQSLRDLASRLKQHTGLKVVLDNQPRLFQPGECPNAALYCGWYSLGKYVDAFTWRAGAVGYHMASMEAETLKNPNSQVWCNAMIRHGICATLGPVYEPYLAAFPLPDDFFPLLLTGQYTLAEAYYRTSPFNSWVMVLIGDPLYNPFKNHPALKPSDLPGYLKPQKTPGMETGNPEQRLTSVDR